jgi:hypothetical protein
VAAGEGLLYREDAASAIAHIGILCERGMKRERGNEEGAVGGAVGGAARLSCSARRWRK